MQMSLEMVMNSVEEAQQTFKKPIDFTKGISFEVVQVVQAGKENNKLCHLLCQGKSPILFPLIAPIIEAKIVLNKNKGIKRSKPITKIDFQKK